MFGISTSLTFCKRSLLLAGVVLLSSCSSASLPAAKGSSAPIPALRAPIGLLQLITQGKIVPNCPPPAAGHVACASYSITAKGLAALSSHRHLQDASSTVPPDMFTPSQIQAAYGLTSASASMGAGRTIAAVVAYDTSPLESDLAVFRSTFGFSPCTTANHCFRKVDQLGGTNYPAQDEGWGGEMTLDVSIFSALCPKCNILVVEANSTNFSDMAAAVNTAVSLGASVVNNSYGMPETGMLAYASSYNHPGIPIVAAAGNGNGWQGYSSVQNVPAAYSTVIAVGETYLQSDNSARGWSDYVDWNSTSGCSTLTAKPSWQHDSLCSMRTLVDVSFTGSCDQEPALGFYDSLAGGWVLTCGSSSAAAAISAIAGLAGTVANNASFLYTNASSLQDDLGGSNGATDASGLCSTPPNSPPGLNFFSTTRRTKGASQNSPGLCNGQSGYDATTGGGVPKGITPFVIGCPPPPSSSSNPHPTPNPSSNPNCTS